MTREINELRFENDWSREKLEDAKKRFHKLITLPVDIEIKGEQTVLSLDEAKNYLKKAEKIVLMDCTCRVQRGNCEAPRHTCLRLDERAEQVLEIDELKKLNPEKITYEQAVEVLEMSHRYGLVHLALAVEQSEINEICSCCECCCIALASTLRFELAPQLLTSKITTTTDKQKCIVCGVCVERCRFSARQIESDSLVTHLDRCLGCGLCVSTCPVQAIGLIEK
jgi:electron transport complex protein RnfB